MDTPLKLSFVLIFACLSCKSTDNKGLTKPDPDFHEKKRQVGEGVFPTRALKVDISPVLAVAKQTLWDALNTSVDDTPAWLGALPKDLDYKHILDPKRKHKGSLSMGSVGSGTLENGVELEQVGQYHEILSQHRKNKTNYGTKELTDLIRHAAFFVMNRYAGAKLRVGNLSQEGGGDIRWSRSHNSGRDADIAFYVLDENGESVEAKALTKCLGDGSIPRFPGYHFDTQRNWAFVEALVQHDFGVQWIFISNPLKEKLLGFAEKTGVREEIIKRATSVLHQPTDALPHDDHFHIRISCPINDRIEGCLPAGPHWDWLPDSRPYQLSRAIELRKAILEGSKTEQHAAIAMLTNTRQLFRADVALSIIGKLKDEKMKLQLIQLAAKPYKWSAYSLAKVQKIIPKESANLAFLNSAYQILRRSMEPQSVGFAFERIQTSTDLGERKLAVHALRHSEDGQTISKLISLLEGADSEIKPLVHEELQFISNHLGHSKIWPKGEDAQEKTIAIWKELSKRLGEDHAKWREDGFKEAGLGETMEADALIAFLENCETFQAYNINRRLREVTGRWSALEFSNQEKLFEKWQKWWRRNAPPKEPMVWLDAGEFFRGALRTGIGPTATLGS